MENTLLIAGLILAFLNFLSAIWDKNIHASFGWLVATILYVCLIIY